MSQQIRAKEKTTTTTTEHHRTPNTKEVIPMGFTNSNIATIETAIRQFLIVCDQDDRGESSTRFTLFTNNCRAAEIQVSYRVIATATPEQR